MSDIIYTPSASGGGGTTINPSNNVIPVRSNATTFIDSNIENDPNNYLKTSANPTSGYYFGLFIDFGNLITSLGDINFSNGNKLIVDDDASIIKTTGIGNDIGLKLDFANRRYYLGDFNTIYNGNSLFIDDYNEQIYTGNQGAIKGLFLDFLNLQYNFGDFNFYDSGTSFYIDVANSTIYTKNNANNIGLNLDFANNVFTFGDYNNLLSGTSFIIDDATQKMTFNTEFLNFVGASLIDGSTVFPAGSNLVVTINGAEYYIPLYKL